MDRSLLEIGEVHGDLGEAANEKSSAFDKAQTSGGKADGFGNLLGDIHIRRVEENVVGDESFAGSNDGGSGGGVNFWLAEIGLAGRVGGDVGADAFELAPANVFQILAFG